jgi:hypothetical protein
MHVWDISGNMPLQKFSHSNDFITVKHINWLQQFYVRDRGDSRHVFFRFFDSANRHSD